MVVVTENRLKIIYAKMCRKAVLLGLKALVLSVVAAFLVAVVLASGVVGNGVLGVAASSIKKGALVLVAVGFVSSVFSGNEKGEGPSMWSLTGSAMKLAGVALGIISLVACGR